MTPEAQPLNLKAIFPCVAHIVMRFRFTFNAAFAANARPSNLSSPNLFYQCPSDTSFLLVTNRFSFDCQSSFLNSILRRIVFLSGFSANLTTFCASIVFSGFFNQALFAIVKQTIRVFLVAIKFSWRFKRVAFLAKPLRNYFRHDVLLGRTLCLEAARTFPRSGSFAYST